ncbi:MAG: hypothetical protein IKK13_00850 [Clostridia bacterium]|nr:hypothetical protein [Clostridia bacterium]
MLSAVGCQKPSDNENQNSGISSEEGAQVANPQTPAELFAPERTVNKQGAVDSVDNLKNTYYKLVNEKKLEVAYLGGSVTNGAGGSNGYCWASATTEWLKTNFPNAQISDTNAGWGGTGSYWGFHRMDDSVLSKNPDLVFLEYAINDAYAGYSRVEASLYMEGIVRKIRNTNPNCDIVIIFVTDNSGAKRLGTEYEQLLGHKDVAEHYGIPTINVGFALVKEMERTGNDWKYYVGDVVHPNNKGYKVYADCIAGYMKNWLIDNPDKSGLSAHEMPDNDYVSNLSVESERIKAADITNVKDFQLLDAPSTLVSHAGAQLFGLPGATMECEFVGRGIGMLVDATKYPVAKITVDGVETIMHFKENFSEYCIYNNLNYGKHTIKVELISGGRMVFGGFLVAK